MSSDLLRHGFVPNHRFIVTMGMIKISFSKVTGLENSIEYDTIQEGGVNDHVRTFTKAKTQQHTIVFEKGVANVPQGLRLFNFKAGSRIKVPITILILQDPNELGISISKAFCFDEGFIVKWETTNLDALGNEIIIERFEIAHTGLRELSL